MDQSIKEVKEATRPTGTEGFAAAFIYRPLALMLTKYLVRTQLKPNQVTAISFFTGLAAAGLFCFGSSLYLKIGAGLLFLCLILDCVDGEIARLKHMESEFGHFLDSFSGIVKDFFIVLGLMLGLYLQTQDISILILGAFVLFTITVSNKVLLISRSALGASFTRNVGVSARLNLRKKIKRVLKIDIDPAYLAFGGDIAGLVIILGAFLNQIPIAFWTIIILGNITSLVEFRLIWGKNE